MTVDRLSRLDLLKAKENTFTGIDFVQVSKLQTQLRIYFLTDVSQLSQRFDVSSSALSPESIVIHNVSEANRPNVEVVTVDGIETDAILNRPYLEITVAQAGEFADYRLRIDDPLSRIDPFFNDVKFSFKVGCGEDQECLGAAPTCPLDPQPDFPVDYLARDFVSFRNALLDFAAQRYPQWTSPIEADVGDMLAEVMAALGDELSYVQDRFAREAFLETASERRSLRKKARLLDYEIHDGRSPSTLVELTVDVSKVNEPPDPGSDDEPPEPGAALLIKAGSRVWATSEGGDPIAFEIGLGLRDSANYPVCEKWNAADVSPSGEGLVPYAFDETQICLPVGATEMFIKGAIPNDELLFNQSTGEGRVLLLRTEPTDPSLPRRRHFVRLIARPTTLVDHLNGDAIVSRIRWGAADALPFEIDQSQAQLSFNVLPVTAGLSRCARFVCEQPLEVSTVPPVVVTAYDRDYPPALKPAPGPAVEREGALPIFLRPSLAAEATPDARTEKREDRPTIFLVGLPDTDTGGLGFLGQDLHSAVPEVVVTEIGSPGTEGEAEGDKWNWVRSLIGADPIKPVFTLDDGLWKRIISFTRGGVVHVHQDYATGAGFSLRFGDGVFGPTPPRGQVFEIMYRLGPGARGNVPEGAINALVVPSHPKPTMPVFVTGVRNPVEVTDGVDPESTTEIKQLLPEAFKADRLFAVTPDDYGEQAEKLDFVQRAQGTPRWTGSWLSMFVAADPLGAFDLTTTQKGDLTAWMNCVRQTGREVIVTNPRPFIIDLMIDICVEPFAYASQVLALVRELLVGSGGGRNTRAFFSPDNFTFGMPLRRSALEATIQRVPGVRFVRSIWYRERGIQAFRPLTQLQLLVDGDRVLRLDDDPLHPEAGILTLSSQGGA